MKKRDILPELNKAIIFLSNLSGDAAKLEINDNDQASRRLKRAITEFKHGPLKELQDKIFEVRNEIKLKKI